MTGVLQRTRGWDLWRPALMTEERMSGQFQSVRVLWPIVAITVRRAAPYGTLFSNIDTGHGLRVFSSAGAVGRGAHAGALTTFWNVRASRRRNRCGACCALFAASARSSA